MKTKDTLILNIETEALLIEDAIKAICKPYKTGIYLSNKSDPIIIPGKYYYRIERISQGNLKEIQVKTIEDINGVVYNKDGEIVINDFISRNKKNYLFTEPTIPVYGRKYIESLVRDYLQNARMYDNCGDNCSNSYRYMNDTFNNITKEENINSPNYLIVEELVLNSTIETRQKLVEFIGTKTWDVIIPTFTKDVIILENTGDFRVQDWMQKFGKK